MKNALPALMALALVVVGCGGSSGPTGPSNGANTVSGASAEGKLSLCHSTGNGSYHSIEVSVNAEAAHRAHGDGKVGEPVPGTQHQVFDANCSPVGPAVSLRKSTNGSDANDAPGPSIVVGSAVTWTYAVSNTGTIPLTGITVTDDRGVAVNCNGQTMLAPGASMTCTGSGVATPGQYRNVGTVTATSTGGDVSATDPSHYLGVTESESDGQKVTLCHRTGSGRYNVIEVSVNAEPAHRAHGDAKIGEAVPGRPGSVFGPGCAVQ
jgi:hypothetical protein